VTYQTADLCDQYPQLVKVADPIFRSYGAKMSFGGQIATIKVHEDNVLVPNPVKVKFWSSMEEGRYAVR